MSAPRMICHYVILQIERDADETTIKKAYRKQALVFHPDKNVGNEEVAKSAFRKVQDAYDTLSSPSERKWYDSHRESILSGGTGTKEGEGGEDGAGGSIFVVDFMGLFTNTCFTGFGEWEDGFFTVYREVFLEIYNAEKNGYEAENAKGILDDFPSFGRGHSRYEDWSRFYNFFGNFNSCLSFSWEDQYDSRDADSRRVRRLMEVENLKKRKDAHREYSNSVVALCEFCRARDPRVKTRRDLVEKEKAVKAKKVKDDDVVKKKERQEAISKWRVEAEEEERQRVFNMTEEQELLERTRTDIFNDSDSDDDKKKKMKSGGGGKKKVRKNKGKKNHKLWVDDDKDESNNEVGVSVGVSVSVASSVDASAGGKVKIKTTGKASVDSSASVSASVSVDAEFAEPLPPPPAVTVTPSEEGMQESSQDSISISAWKDKMLGVTPPTPPLLPSPSTPSIEGEGEGEGDEEPEVLGFAHINETELDLEFLLSEAKIREDEVKNEAIRAVHRGMVSDANKVKEVKVAVYSDDENDDENDSDEESESEEEADESDYESESEEEEEPDFYRCQTCKKDFKSKPQFENHVNSRKHKDAEKALKRKTNANANANNKTKK